MDGCLTQCQSPYFPHLPLNVLGKKGTLGKDLVLRKEVGGGLVGAGSWCGASGEGWCGASGDWIAWDCWRGGVEGDIGEGPRIAEGGGEEGWCGAEGSWCGASGEGWCGASGDWIAWDCWRGGVEDPAKGRGDEGPPKDPARGNEVLQIF
ncbi:hypothetical protein BGX38DRAFT_1271435 [Terfezia claveryi]|nr:hypothetical protein BGX38DRAFT_1271435 [Terfezia claveryi]